MGKVHCILYAVVLLVAVEATGGDFGSDMTIGIQALPVSPDLAAMGGLNISIPTTAGNNPALNGLLSETTFRETGCVEGYWLDFGKGPTLAIGVVNAATSFGKGSLKLNYYQVGTVSKGSKTILDPNMFEAESWELAYGLKLTDNLAIGLSIPYSESEVSSRVGPLTLGHGKSQTEFATTTGVFWRITPKLNLAGTWAISSEKNSETELWSTTRYKSLTNAVRLGVSVQPWKGGTFGAEVLGVRVEKPGEIENAVKVFYGAEQYLNEHFCLRAGSLNGGFAAGFGIVIGKRNNIWIDAAYLANPVVMDKYWGESQGFQVSFSAAW